MIEMLTFQGKFLTYPQYRENQDEFYEVYFVSGFIRLDKRKIYNKEKKYSKLIEQRFIAVSSIKEIQQSNPEEGHAYER